jgi:LysR family glycine cleavage system transcriptional activator
MVAHLPFPLVVTPVATPALVKRLGPLKRPRDLLRLPLISPTDPAWRIWFEAAGLSDTGRLSYEGPSFGVQHLEGKAALAGQGVAMLTPSFFAAELKSGALVRLFDITADSGESYWFAYPKARANTAKLRAFRTWLLAEAAVEQMPSA